MNGVPCTHVVAAINKSKMYPEDFVMDYFNNLCIEKPISTSSVMPLVLTYGPKLPHNTLIHLFPKTRKDSNKLS